MTDTKYDEEQIRRIAREEARDVAGIEVEGPDGGQWSLSKLMENFEISRRTALQAMGLIALGYHAPKAVLQVFAQDGEAAAQDNLTVPGTLSAGAIDTEEARISGPIYLGDSTRDGSEEFVNESIGWKPLIGVDSQGNQGAVLTLRIDYNGLDASGTDVINVDTSQGITTGTNSTEWGSTGDVTSVASDVRFKVDDNNAEILFIQVYVPDDFWFGSVSYSTTTRQTDYV